MTDANKFLKGKRIKTDHTGELLIRSKKEGVVPVYAVTEKQITDLISEVKSKGEQR